MKFILFIFSLFLCVLGFSQDIKYRFTGMVVNQDLGKKEAGVKVAVLMNGAEVSSGVTGSNGRYDFAYSAKIGSKFTVVYTKAGLVSKRFNFDGSKMNPEDLVDATTYPIDTREIALFAERPGVDFSFLNTEPIANMFYDPEMNGNNIDVAALNKMKKKIDDILAKAPELPNEDDAKYTEALKAGDAMFGEKKYEEAIVKYELANSIKPKEKEPTTKIIECEKLLAAKKKEQLAAQQADSEYTNLIKAADNLRDQKKYDDAISKYNDAIKKKSSDPYPVQQIAAINKLKDEEKNKAASEAKLKELITAGDNASKANKLDEAKAKYQEAIAIKDDPAVKAKLDDVSKKIAENQSKEQAKAKVDALFTEAGNLQSQGKLEEAKSKYQEVAKLDPTKTEVAAKIKEIDEQLSKNAANKQKTEKVNTLLQAAAQLQSSGNLKDAKTKYQEVLTLDPTQAEAKEKIASLDKQIAEGNSQAEKKAKIDKFLSDANALLAKNDLENAKSKFDEVIKLDPTNSVAQGKITEINAKLNAAKGQAEKDKQFDNLKTEGLKLLAEKKWTEAKSKLEEANAIKTDANVTAKIKEAETQLAAEKQKTDKISAAITAGDQLKTSGKLKEAKVKYQEALNLDPNQSSAKEKISEIDAQLNGQSAENARKEKIEKLLSEGNTLFAKNELDNAKNKMEEVLKLDPTNGDAKSKISEIEAKRNESKNEEIKYEKFDNLKSEGIKLVEEKKWAEAKAKLTEASKLKTDPKVKEKLEEAEAGLRDMELQAKIDKEYAKLMAESEEMIKAKNYDGAIAKLKEAYVKKPTESKPKEKMAEIEELKKAAMNQAEIDAQYRALMNQGDKLVAEKIYVDAIKKFNQALVLKPDEIEPVEKAKQAQEAEEARGSEDKKNYEKIISGISKAIAEKDYLRAKELIDRAKSYNKQFNIAPNDPRPGELLQKVTEIQSTDQKYKETIDAAKIAQQIEEFKKAIEYYEAAHKLKPEEELPVQKITEINKIIEELSTKAERSKLFSTEIAAGEANTKGKKYEEAIKNYEKALQIIPNDPTAIAKLNETKKIIETIEQNKKRKEENTTQYKKYIKEGDQSAEQKQYQEAKKDYELALSLISDDKYAMKKIMEMDRLLKQSSDKEKEIAYKKAIKEADEYYNKKGYEKAKESYIKALEAKLKDLYASRKLKEVETILTAKVIETEKLKPLGEPFEGSILDGMAALNQAELERQKLEKAKLAEGVKDIGDKEKSLEDQKKNEREETSSQVFKFESSKEKEVAKVDVKRLEITKTTGEFQKKSELDNLEANNFEINSNLKMDENLHAINKEQAEQSQTSLALSDDEKIKAYKSKKLEAVETMDKEQHSKYISSDQQIREYKLTEVQSPENDDKKRASTQENIDQKDSQLESSTKTTDEKKADNRQEAYKTVNALITEKDEKEYKNSLTVHDISDKVKNIEKTTGEVVLEGVKKDEKEGMDVSKEMSTLVNKTEIETTEKNEKQKENAQTIHTIQKSEEKSTSNTIEQKTKNLYTTDNTVDEFKTGKQKVENLHDENRLETVETTKKLEMDQMNKSNEAASVQTEKTAASLATLNHEAKKNQGTLAQEDEKKLTTIVGTKKMLEKSETSGNQIESNKDLQGKKLNSHLNVVNDKTTAETNTREAGEKVNPAILQNIEKSLANQNAENTAIQENKHNNSQQLLNETHDEPTGKPVIKNGLGAQYPEGVSQESFTNKDQNGLMTSIITRRIVVIEGNGVVYVRTQTLQGTTYSKNGKPITEYMWQKETQAAHLKKNY